MFSISIFIVSFSLTSILFSSKAGVRPILRFKSANESTLFHSDVVQGIISENINFHNSGIESAAISAHKIGGPKGVGAMFINNKYKLPSFLHGGKQELERRAGTVDVPGIASFAAALE